MSKDTERNRSHASENKGSKAATFKPENDGPMPMKRRLAMGLDVDVENDPHGEGTDRRNLISNNQGKRY